MLKMKTKLQGSVRLSITFVVSVPPVCSHGPGIRLLMSHFLCHTWAHQGGLTTPTEWSQDICLTKHTEFGLKFLPDVESQQMALSPSSLLLGGPALWKRRLSPGGRGGRGGLLARVASGSFRGFSSTPCAASRLSTLQRPHVHSSPLWAAPWPLGLHNNRKQTPVWSHRRNPVWFGDRVALDFKSPLFALSLAVSLPP